MKNQALIDEFVAYLEEMAAAHCIYVFGAQGQGNLTEEWILAHETSPANGARAVANFKKQVAAGFGETLRAFDCSGLGMYFFCNKKKLSPDKTAHGMMSLCRTLIKEELAPGDFVFRVNAAGRAYHIGYVVDAQKNVVEARGRSWGVQKRALTASGKHYWNRFGRPEWYGEEEEQAPAFSRLLSKKSPMLRGTDVKNLQLLLQKAGETPGAIDGVFGKKTKAALVGFQKKNALAPDGILGPLSAAALGAVWRK